MNSKDFAEINVEIAVREQTFISPETFQKLLEADDQIDLLAILGDSVYSFESKDLASLEAIDSKLLERLVDEYNWAFSQSPSQALVAVFAVRYVYHNLKVLLKGKALERDFSHLLIPIGAEGIEELEHLVTTLHSDYLEPELVDEVRSIWEDYQTYQNHRILEIGADLAYFRHLKRLAADLDSVLQQLVRIVTDFYNVIAVKRGLSQQKTDNGIYQVLSDEGSFSAKAFIQMVEEEQLIDWFGQLNTLLDADIDEFEDRIRRAEISTVDLEYLSDFMLFKLLDSQDLALDGPLPLAMYLLRCEFEIKNLRLILSAYHNHLPSDLIAERMRPIYGQ